MGSGPQILRKLEDMILAIKKELPQLLSLHSRFHTWSSVDQLSTPQEVAGRLGLVYKCLTHHYLRLASIAGASLKEGNCELRINLIGICY